METKVPSSVVSAGSPGPASLLLKQAELEVPAPVPMLDARAVIYSRGSPQRPGNQDAAMVVKLCRGAVVAVADGMGGAAAGAVAAAVSIEALQRATAPFVGQEDVSWPQLRNALLDGLEQANRDVCRRRGVGGATVVAAVIVGSKLRCLTVGDSQALVVGQRGQLKHLTGRHSPVGHAVEAGVLDLDEALFHPLLHVLSNAIGSRSMYVEIGPEVKLKARDTVLVGTDGLFDNLFMDEVVEMIRKGVLLDRATALARLARERMTAPVASQPSDPARGQLGGDITLPGQECGDDSSGSSAATRGVQAYDDFDDLPLRDPRKPDDMTFVMLRGI